MAVVEEGMKRSVLHQARVVFSNAPHKRAGVYCMWQGDNEMWMGGGEPDAAQYGRTNEV